MSARSRLSVLVAVAVVAVALAAPTCAAEPAPSSAPSAPAADDADLEALITAMARTGSAAGAQYSPYGTQIAYLTNLSGVAQVWRIPAEGGYPRMVTSGPDAAQGVRWSPDGRLAYAVAPGGGYNAALKLTTIEGTGTVPIDDDGDANTFVGEFAKDGRYFYRSNARDPDSTDAYVWDPKTGTSKLAFQVDGLGGISDLIGDKALAWQLVTRGNTDLYLHDLTTGKRTLLTEHEGPATVFGRFGADARTVYVGHDLGRDRIEFGKLEIGENGSVGGMIHLAARDDAELDDFELSDDAGTALLVWNVGGRNELERIDLASGKRTPLPPAPAELVYSADIAPNGRDAVLSLAGSQSPADLYVLDMDAGKYRRLTWSPHPGVDLATLVKPELRTFAAHDGLALSGWLYLPKGFAAPGPVVLSFHGGPEGQEQPAFRSDYQALLASGIAVFAPNIRGSSGFGKKFMGLDNHELRFDANRDILSAAEFLVREGIGAKDRLGITGGSYGGYATMVGVTEFPDTFAAAANLFGMVNFETFFAQSTPWMGAISTGEYGDPKTQRQLLRDLSPIHKLDRVTTPLLVMHGANDTNVPVVEAEQIVETLEKRGVDVQYVLFPDEGHGWRKEANRVRSTLELTRFFREHLLAE
jgi:dipeptidyl aminopeptidase/acylaminoacyl peptidase